MRWKLVSNFGLWAFAAIVIAYLGQLLRQQQQIYEIQEQEFRRLHQRLTHVQREQDESYRQLDALMALHQQIHFTAPLPPMRRWAISPDFALILLSLLDQQKPHHVLELGSGISTLLMAYRLPPQAQITSVDHDERFLEETRTLLARHGFEERVTFVHAPIKSLALEGETWQWYDASVFKTIRGVDFLLVDGPAQEGSPQEMVRYPALPMLEGRLNDKALILLDDAARHHERQIIQRWLDEGRGSLQRSWETEKGAVLLQKTVIPF